MPSLTDTNEPDGEARRRASSSPQHTAGPLARHAHEWSYPAATPINRDDGNVVDVLGADDDGNVVDVLVDGDDVIVG